MKYTYEDLDTVVKRVDAVGNESFIPKDANNLDYRAYLKWLTEQ